MEIDAKWVVVDAVRVEAFRDDLGWFDLRRYANTMERRTIDGYRLNRDVMQSILRRGLDGQQ